MPESAASFRIPRPAILAIAGVMALAALVLFYFDPRGHHFYPMCYFHRLTGLLCPGCGGLRGLHQLLHGNVATAFRFNPMLVVLAPFAIWLGARCALQWAKGQPVSVDVRPFWLWLALAAALAVSVLRNLPGAPFDLLRP